MTHYFYGIDSGVDFRRRLQYGFSILNGFHSSLIGLFNDEACHASWLANKMAGSIHLNRRSTIEATWTRHRG